MRGSTLASGSAERRAAGVPRSLGAVRLRRFLHHPAGLAGLAITVAMVVVAVLADWLAPTDPLHAFTGQHLRPPSWAHPMGTDNIGRDVYANVVHGARTSMTVVLWVVAMSTAIGLTVGALAGYRGGLVDDVAMRVAEIVQSMPRFFLALSVAAWFGRGTGKLVLLLGLTSWTMLARVTRAEVLSVRERAYVRAARAMGATNRRILTRHVVPNVLPASIAVIGITGSRVIMVEAGLAFLGLGDPRASSWGTLIGNAQGYLDLAWWMSVFPGLALVLAVLGLNLVADAVNDALAPGAAGAAAHYGRPRSTRRRPTAGRAPGTTG